MTRIGKTLMISAGLMAAALWMATPVQAGPITQPGPDAAQINGGPESPGRDLFEVEFTAIDGDNISPRQLLWLEPGRYVITVRVDARYTTAPDWQIRQPNRDDDYVSFEIELEAGKRYDIRGRYNRNDRRHPYDVIVDRIEG
ncbi:hypothetical protein [Wenzhouxiangella marina]|uniref:hypothetical protein n=1 Tax=Wenzhouxiangella marina TaxID=1579979 RepID=UPI000673C5B1|nr:hypothetical protein [Wenzhouxiangella marina]MBB6087538.1 hypothetical protein [Wenzhouxiangella marina]